MDKYEYKVRYEEITNLISAGEFGEAVKIADTIDWSKVRSVPTLCKISDLYKVNRRFQESKEILLMAYEKYPQGRLIVFSLCNVSIQLGEIVQANEYYKEYRQNWPKDSGKYVLNYRILQAVDASLEERVKQLEEFKRADYKPKWGYELAYLYHQMGLGSKCVDECEEVIITFGEGRYVIKAMELKKLHEPLTASEQAKYDKYMQKRIADANDGEESDHIEFGESVSDVKASIDDDDIQGAPTAEMPQEMDIQVKPVDVGQYNTMNLQEALAESMKELLDTDVTDHIVPSVPEENIEDNTIFANAPLAGASYQPATEETAPESGTVNGEVNEASPVSVPEPVPAPVPAPAPVPSTLHITRPAVSGSVLSEETKRIPTDAVVDYLETQKLVKEMQTSAASIQAVAVQAEMIPGAVTGQLETVGSTSSAYDQMLAEEYSGQIRLAISEAEQVEKQITGQLSIEDVLADWEETKKANVKKREEEVRQRILQHTGSLFDEFDEDTRTTLLEQLEKAFMEAMLKENKGELTDEALGKKIRKEAMRAVEYMTMDGIIGQGVSEAVKDSGDTDVKEESVTESPAADSEETVTDTGSGPSDEEAEENGETETGADGEKDETAVSSDQKDAGDQEEESPDPDKTDNEDLRETEDDESDSVSGQHPDGTDSIEVAEVRKALEEDEKEAKTKSAGKNHTSKEADKTDADTEADGDGEDEGTRVLTDEEKELFGAYLTRRSTAKQISQALDNMSMAAYTGNVIVTGEEGVGTIDLAKKLIKYMQATDSNFVNKQVAKISGKSLNNKDLNSLFDQIKGGAIIINNSRGMKKSTVQKLIKVLENENLGVLAVLEDTSEGMDKIVGTLPKLGELFNVRIDLKALDDKALVNYAREYALSQEHVIDEFALLALHTRIAEMQTSSHQVSVAEVRDLVDDAIYYADKKNPSHLFDIILHKRYDEDDMIILREKDFMHY